MYHAVLFLLADIKDVLGGIVPFLIFIFWLVSQFLSKKGGAAQAPKPGAPKPGAQKPGVPRQGPQPPPGPQPDKLTDEIEKFLRRAAQKQAGHQQVDVEVLQPAEVAAAEPVVVAQMVKPDEPRRLVTSELFSAEPIEQVPSGRGVAAHVEAHVGGSAFEERTSRLGEEVGLADDKLEDRLHATFDHQVGRLSALPSATTGATLTQDPYEVSSGDDESTRGVDSISAGDVSPISPIFSGPEDVRRAIILHEIFQRPQDRW